MSDKRSSSLLIDEQPLQVIPSLAEALGVNAAILLQQINYWIKHAEKGGDERKYKRGKWWTYNSYADWQTQMPWLSESGVRKLVKKLRDLGLIAVVKLKSQDQDHTLWYTINYEAVEGLRTSGQIEPPLSDTSNCPAGTPEVPQSDTSYMESENPENQSENSPRGAATPPEPKPEAPAKAMTTLTVQRTTEVGFDAAPHQKANWGQGWAKFCYVEEGKDPPSTERQFAVLGEIVGAASGKGGKARYFLSVDDAVKRVEGARKGRLFAAPEPEKGGEFYTDADTGKVKRKKDYSHLFGETA